jgi:heme/copper-type cytochrome/quinol oxidase subunit 4
MNDSAKLDRAIRFSLVGGMALLAIAAVEVALIAAGIVPWEARTAILLAFGVVSASLALLTVRQMRQDRNDPAGIEQRYESQAEILGAAVVVVGVVAVVALIAWAVLASPG